MVPCRGWYVDTCSRGVCMLLKHTIMLFLLCHIASEALHSCLEMCEIVHVFNLKTAVTPE